MIFISIAEVLKKKGFTRGHHLRNDLGRFFNLNSQDNLIIPSADGCDDPVHSTCDEVLIADRKLIFHFGTRHDG